MPDFSVLLPILSITIALMAAIGVVVAFLGNKNRGLSEVQSSTITALQAQNEAQEKQIRILEKKIARCEGVISTLQVTLKRRRGLLLEVNGELITITNQRTGAEETVKIQIDSDEMKAIEKED